jgi:NAD/NADP transhydrogenase alpha subunit
LNIFIPRERRRGERRVAATPETTRWLLQLGFAVTIETRAGQAASFGDEDYREAGASIVTDTRKAWTEADIVLKVQPPDEYTDIAGCCGCSSGSTMPSTLITIAYLVAGLLFILSLGGLSAVLPPSLSACR